MTFVDNIRADFSGKAVDSLSPIRQGALEGFAHLGLPSARHEEWKYTNIKTHLPERLTLANNGAKKVNGLVSSWLPTPAIHLVFVNGNFDGAQSILPVQEGLLIGNLADMSHANLAIFEKYFNHSLGLDRENFALLNTAFASNGAFIYVKKGVAITDTIYITHYFDAQSIDDFTQIRNLIIAEENSSVNIVENFVNTSEGKCYNQVSEVFVEAGAAVNYAYLQIENKESVSINNISARLAKDARYHVTTISLAGTLIRNNINASLEGQGAEATLHGLYICTDDNHIDNHILVDHRVSHCDSHQVYKGVLDDASTGVFNGKIYVQPDAQKTNAFQSSKAILLSGEASMNSKPQLEIFADDVKCSHGAAIGQVSKNELFYLMARGIDEATAKGILTYAFANDVINAIKIEEVKAPLVAVLKQQLGIDF